MSTGVRVRPVEAADRGAWGQLWDGYIAFYDADVTPGVTDHTCARLLDTHSQMFGLVAEFDSQIIGFAHCVLHDNTWAKAPVCYLEDLFIASDVRGQGAGRALIEAVQKKGREERWRHIYWRTDKDNAIAQVLYNKIAKHTTWVTYEMDL